MGVMENEVLVSFPNEWVSLILYISYDNTFLGFFLSKLQVSSK